MAELHSQIEHGELLFREAMEAKHIKVLPEPTTPEVVMQVEFVEEPDSQWSA